MEALLSTYDFLSWVLRAATLAAQALAVGGAAFLVFNLASVDPQRSAFPTLLCTKITFWSAAVASAGAFLSTLALAAVLVGTLQIDVATAAQATAVRYHLSAAIAAGALATLVRSSRTPPPALMSILCLALIGAHVGVTHAASRTALSPWLIVAEAVHLGALAIWIGGVPHLIVALRTTSRISECRRVARRFSFTSIGAVLAIAASGAALAMHYVDAPQALYETNYGILLDTKSLLFLFLLCFGAVNYFVVRRFQKDAAAPIANVGVLGEAEAGIGCVLVLCAAALASSPVAADVRAQPLSPSEIVERFAPRWPRFVSPAYAQLSVAEQKAPTETLADASTAKSASDIAWAEVNHHFAGVLVALMGVFALLERSPRASPLARHWPLLFLLMSGFLILRADEGAWPLGRVGFFESLATPEVAQHKLIIALIAAFAVFEWRVRLKKFDRAWPAYVFPVTTLAAAGFLLTHYGHNGGKEEVLMQIGHLPVALCGVVAASARWLEIRLPERSGRLAALIWPIAFVLSGVLLVFYREA